MTTVYIDGDAASNGTGADKDDPRNVIPTSATNGDTYLFKEGTKNYLTLNWTLSKTGVTLGTYDAATGEQITDSTLGRFATLSIVDTGSTNVMVINPGGTTNLHVTCLELVNDAPNAINWLGIYASSNSTGFQLTDCKIHAMRSPRAGTSSGNNGISLSGTAHVNCYIARNEIYDIGCDGINIAGTVGNTGLIIEDNYIHHVAQDNANGDCLQLSQKAPDFLIRRNVLDRRTGLVQKQCFIASTMTSTGGIFCDNDLYADDVATVVLYVDNAGAQVLRNRVFGGSQGIEVQGDGSIVAGNLVVAGSRHPVDYKGIRIAGGTGILVYNNTFASARVASDTSNGILQVTGTCTLKNNIVKGYSTGVTITSGSNSNNCLYDCTTNGITPAVTTDPQLRSGDHMPQSEDVRAAGAYLGHRDVYGKRFWAAPTIGAVQYQPARNLVAARAVAARRAVAA